MNSFHPLARRYLSQRLKRWVKGLFHGNNAKAAVEIPLHLSSGQKALCVWSHETPLARARQRASHPNRRIAGDSIIMFSHNELHLTRLYLESLYRSTDYPSFKLIVVDDASTDGTRAHLEGLKQFLPNLHHVFI